MKHFIVIGSGHNGLVTACICPIAPNWGVTDEQRRSFIEGRLGTRALDALLKRQTLTNARQIDPDTIEMLCSWASLYEGVGQERISRILEHSISLVKMENPK